MPARRKSKSRSSRGPRRVRRSSGKKARTSVTQRRSPKRTYKGVDARLYGKANGEPLWYINVGNNDNWFVLNSYQLRRVNLALKQWVNPDYPPDPSGIFHERHLSEIREDKFLEDIKFVNETRRIYLKQGGEFREVRELPSPYKLGLSTIGQ